MDSFTLNGGGKTIFFTKIKVQEDERWQIIIKITINMRVIDTVYELKRTT